MPPVVESRRGGEEGAYPAMSTIFLMTRSQRSRIWSGDSPSGQPMVQMSQSSPISDRIVDVVLPVSPWAGLGSVSVKTPGRERAGGRAGMDWTFADSVLPLADVVLDRDGGFLLRLLEQEVVRLSGALPRRDKDVLDVGGVEDLALADDAGAEVADDRLAVLGERDVSQPGLFNLTGLSALSPFLSVRAGARESGDVHVDPKGTTRSLRVG